MNNTWIEISVCRNYVKWQKVVDEYKIAQKAFPGSLLDEDMESLIYSSWEEHDCPIVNMDRLEELVNMGLV